MDPHPEIAEVAAHFADRSRSRMLLDLLDGTARPASRLAEAAGVSASTASEHLARLTQAGLVLVEAEGRVRRYRLAGDHVALVLEALMPLARNAPRTGLTDHTRWQRLRVARTCYDHAAGALGTDIMAALIEGDALVATDADARCPYAVGDAATEWCRRIGIDLPALSAQRRPLVRVCVDWTEQRHHLGGGLGAAILQAFLDREWVARRPGRRDLTVREPEHIRRWLTGR